MGKDTLYLLKPNFHDQGPASKCNTPMATLLWKEAAESRNT